MPGYQVKGWVADMKRFGGFKTDEEIAKFAGIKPTSLRVAKYNGAGKPFKAKCAAALSRVRPVTMMPKPVPKPVLNALDLPEVDPRGPHGEVMRLIMMHRSLPEDQRTLGRAATTEERAAFLRRQKRGM